MQSVDIVNSSKGHIDSYKTFKSNFGDENTDVLEVDIVNSSECHIYKTFKSNFGYEMYLIEYFTTKIQKSIC